VGPSLIKVYLDFFLFFKALWMLLTGKYDFIHTHEEGCFIGILARKIWRIPHLYDMHSSLPEQFTNFEYTKSRFVVKVFTWLEHLTLKNADIIITICPHLSGVVKSVVPEKEPYLVENTFTEEEQDPCPESEAQSLRNDLGIGNAPMILYAGTFEAYQGLDILVEAAAEVLKERPEVHFVLVGGNPAQVEEIRQFVREHKINNHVHLTGNLSPARIPCFIAACTALVSVRKQGVNTPLKIYSYMKSGKPIVATRHMTHTQVLDDSTAVLTGLEPGSLAKGILEILENPEKTLPCAKRAKETANTLYSNEAYMNKMKTIVTKMKSIKEKT
jgi:glycosyltransferase involved in cell wall biosynthesis